MSSRNKPIISLIVPAYNVAEFLPDCLQSLGAQTDFEDYEIIVIDDGSTDGTAKICDEYQSDKLYVIHQKNAGLSGARNTGIKQARGEFLSFVDGDDVVSPDFLKRLYDTAIKTSADIVICDFAEFSAKLPTFSHKISTPTFTDGHAAAKRLLIAQENRDVIICNKLFRGSLFSDIEFPVGKLHEDNLTTYKLLSTASRVASISEPLYYYRKRSGSIMAEQDLLARLKVKETAAKEAINFFKNNTDLKNAAEIALLLSKFAYLDNIASGKIKNQALWQETVQEIKAMKPAALKNPYLTSKLKLYLKMLSQPSLYRLFRKSIHE